MIFAQSIFIYLLALAALTTLFFFVFKRFFPSTAMGWTKLVARITMVVATLYATTTAITAVIPNGLMKIDIRAVQFWPKLPSALHEYKANGLSVSAGGFETATVYVHGVGVIEKLWLVFGAFSLAATIIALCIAAERIAQALVSGNEFRAVSGNLLRRIAVFTVIGGEVAHLAADTGANLIAQRLQQASYGFSGAKMIPNPWLENGDSSNAFQIFGHPQIMAGFFGSIEIWPILVGIGLYLLARIFESGSKLTADTEGLV